MDEINFGELGIAGSIFIVVAICLAVYLKSYFAAAGKNFADKKDIEFITQKVEGIKTQNAATLALLNANISLAAKGIESFESEAFKSYVAFHQATVYVFRDLTILDLSLLNNKNLPYLNEYANLTMAAYKTLSIAKANLDLFNDDAEISEAAFNLHEACIVRLGEISPIVVTIKFLVEQLEFNRAKSLEILLKEPPDSELSEYHYKSLKEYEEKLNQEIDNLKSAMTGISLANGSQCQSKYESLIRKFIRDEKLKILAPEATM